MLEILVLFSSAIAFLTSWPEPLPAESSFRPSKREILTTRKSNIPVLKETSKIAHDQYEKLPSGIYRYYRLGSLNETIYLPSGDNMDTWIAPHGIAKTCPFYLSGYDYEERPVWFVDMGRCTSRNFVKEGYGEAFQFYQIQFLHMVTKSILRRKLEFNKVETGTTIFDMNEMKVSYIGNLETFRYFLEFTREYNNYGLRFTEEFILVNLNFAARAAFNAMKSILGPAGEKVTVWGKLKRHWIPRLLQKVPKKSLPPAFGGNANFQPIQVYGEYFNA